MQKTAVFNHSMVFIQSKCGGWDNQIVVDYENPSSVCKWMLAYINAGTNRNGCIYSHYLNYRNETLGNRHK